MKPRPAPSPTLLRLRRRLRWTQSRMAAELGITPGHLSRIERGRVGTSTTLMKLARRLRR